MISSGEVLEYPVGILPNLGGASYCPDLGTSIQVDLQRGRGEDYR